MSSELFEKYSAVKINIATLEKEKVKIGTELLEHMEKFGIMDYENDFGKFAVSKKKSWEYSDNYLKLGADLKDLQVTEQADGTAKFIETPFLRFTAPKI